MMTLRHAPSWVASVSGCAILLHLTCPSRGRRAVRCVETRSDLVFSKSVTSSGVLQLTRRTSRPVQKCVLIHRAWPDPSLIVAHCRMSHVSPPPTLSTAAPVARPPLPHPLRRNWIWFSLQQIAQTLFTVWFRFRALGIENLPQSGALLLINHQSFLDPLLVGVALRRPVSYLARDNLFQFPVLGWLLKRTYVMPISRESAGTESLRESLRRMEHGFLVGIFPEGTRSDDGALGELKPGFVALVRRTKMPVIPVGVAGGHDAFPRGAWFPRPSKVRVVFGPPLDPIRLAELCQKGREAEFIEWTRASMQTCLETANAVRQ